MKRLLLATIAATALSGGSAWATACTTAPVSTYTAGGFSCSVGTVTFSNIAVNTVTSGSGTVTLGKFSPFFSGNEFGLSLNYAANTGLSGGTADVAWTYNVASTPDLTDAFMAFAGNTNGQATATLSEVLSNGVTLSLNAPGSITKTFAPIGSLSVIKDQNDFAASGSFATTSVLQNAFSTTAVAEPASLAVLGFGLVGLGFIGRRRR